MEKKAGTGKKAQMGRPSRAPKSTKAAGGMDLSALFGAAAQALSANQSSLNQADEQNQNHGDNMVQMFSMITQAMQSQKGAPPAQQLSHASQVLAQNGTSGSAKVYSQGLAQAAQQFQGQKSVNPDNAMMLVQSLLGSGHPAAPQGRGALLDGLLGGVEPAPQGNSGQNDGIDMGDVLNAGMAFMNAKNQGQDNMQAALSALVSAGPLGQSSHRQQSGQLVGNALLQAIAGMAKRK